MPTTVRFFSYFYAPCIGGGEVILQHQAEELVRRGYVVHIHTTPYTNLDCRQVARTGTAVENGVHVHRRASFVLPFRNPLEQNAVTPSFAAEAWYPADLLVAVGFPSLHLDALHVRSRVTRTPLVVQNYVTAEFLAEILAGQGGAGKRVRAAYWRHWTRPQLQAANLVIADSPAAAAALGRELGLANVRCHIGMAVDPAEFDGASQIAEVRQKLGLGDARVLLAPSRISRQKGADLLVEAALPLLARHPAWKLVICGPVNDATFAASVRAAAGNSGQIVITELARGEFVSLVRAAEIVVLPSRGETVGGVVLEGMYCGALAVVSDAVEAARDDYVKDGVNGLLFRSENVVALRAALERGMSEDTSAMRREGARMVGERFTWSASVDRLLELYEVALA